MNIRQEQLIHELFDSVHAQFPEISLSILIMPEHR